MTTQDDGPKTPTAKELTWRFETVRAMSGSQFELYVAGLLRAMGHNTRVLGGSGDQGVDLIADYQGERVAVQCKNYAKPVGNKPVQEVFAGAQHHRCQQAWVVAPAGFTNGASELARSVGVQLFAAGSIRAWIGEVDKVASPHPRSESFPPTYPTSELRKQDSESYHTLLDDYEMELTRLERVREELSTNPYMDEDRSLKASTVQILVDTQARIFDIRKQLDAFEKLGTGSLEQKQRHAQQKARHEQIQEKADQEVRKRHGGGQMSGRGRRWRASEDPLWVWGCGGPTIGCLVILLVITIALWTFFLGGDIFDGVIAGLIVFGGIVGLLYAAAKYYS
jgi:Restriction endonuclease